MCFTWSSHDYINHGNHLKVFQYLAVSAPLVIRVLISSSWPYLAATWRGVLPYLSTQSISPPNGKQERWSELKYHKEERKICTNTFAQINQMVESFLPFWMRIWERVKRPWMAAMCRGLFPSLLCGGYENEESIGKVMWAIIRRNDK